MGWFHKKRLFGNNYPVTYHIWHGYLTNIASEHTPKLRLPCQNCHGYFTTFASKHRSKTIGYLPLLPFLKKVVTKIATVTMPKLPRLPCQNCHGYFTKIATIYFSNLMVVYILETIFLFAWFENSFLKKHQKEFSNGK